MITYTYTQPFENETPFWKFEATKFPDGSMKETDVRKFHLYYPDCDKDHMKKIKESFRRKARRRFK